jgi:hypothetical protein
MSLDTTLKSIKAEVGKRDDVLVRDVLKQTVAADTTSPTAKLSVLKLSRAEALMRIEVAKAEAARILASVAFEARYVNMVEEVAMDVLKAARFPETGSYKDPSGVSLKVTPTAQCVATVDLKVAVEGLSKEYVRVVPEQHEPDLNRIKAAINNGETIPGFTVVKGVSEKVNW